MTLGSGLSIAYDNERPDPKVRYDPKVRAELDAQLMFEPDEWQAAYILNKKKLPDKAPTLNEVVRLVARLGGFLARTGDGEPGVKTIWLGMQRILDFAAGIRFSRALQAQGTCV